MFQIGLYHYHHLPPYPGKHVTHHNMLDTKHHITIFKLHPTHPFIVQVIADPALTNDATWEREGTKFRQTEIVCDILVAALLPFVLHCDTFERIARQVYRTVFVKCLTYINQSDQKSCIEECPITLTLSRILCAGMIDQ
jgi:hypothetical protein